MEEKSSLAFRVALGQEREGERYLLSQVTWEVLRLLARNAKPQQGRRQPPMEEAWVL